MEAPLKVEGVWKRFGRTLALRGVNLSVEGPGLHVLYGPNGSGKSTLIRIILGIYKPSRGRVLLYGVEPYRDPRVAGRLVASGLEGAWVPPYLSGKALALAYAAERGVPVEVVEDYAGRLGVTGYWGRPVYTYSMGMRKRLLLALALAGAREARMLVLDEPYTLLDRDSLALVSEMIAEAAGRIPVIVATHIITEAERRAERLILMESGNVARVVERGEAGAYRCPLGVEEAARRHASRHGGGLLVDYSLGELVVYGVPEPPGEGCEPIIYASRGVPWG